MVSPVERGEDLVKTGQLRIPWGQGSEEGLGSGPQGHRTQGPAGSCSSVPTGGPPEQHLQAQPQSLPEPQKLG